MREGNGHRELEIGWIGHFGSPPCSPQRMRQTHEVQTAMQLNAAPFLFSRFFEDVQVARPLGHHALQVEWFPDGRTHLVFRVFEEGRRGDLWVVGPRMRAMFKNAPDVVRSVSLAFKPGWSAPLLGVPATVAKNQFVPLDALWGPSASALCQQALRASSDAEVLDLITHAFAARSEHGIESASARIARQAVRLVEAGEVRVERVAHQLGVTGRHLHRAFTQNIGIGPKEFTQTVRLQRAIRASAKSADWGRIAADAGYYDQAHLIGDFRELIGLTPGAFIRRAGRCVSACNPPCAAGEKCAPTPSVTARTLARGDLEEALK